MRTQFGYFRKDVTRMLGKNKLRILVIWMSRGFIGVMLYRWERSLFLLFGPKYQYIRLLGIPFFNIFQAYSNIDIHYKANIGGGLNILHPSMGVVISGRATIGANCTLIGGNVIGVENKKKSSFIIGSNLHMGANSVIIGPLTLGTNCTIGAMACATRSFEENDITLIGIPAKPIGI